MNPKILHEEKDFLVIDKPAGLLSQQDKSGDPCAAEVMKKHGANGFLAPVHRLDRNTSGVLVLAKNKEAAAQWGEMFRGRDMEKTYLAIVKGDPGAKGEYNFPLKKNNDENQVYEDESGAEALTEFRQLQKLGNSSLVEIRLHTGRPHQIRAHFSLAGHALIGDKKYGKKPWSEIFHRPALHAHKLIAIWNGKKIAIKAPIPQDFSELLLKLGGEKI